MTAFSALDSANASRFFQSTPPFYEAWDYLVDLPEDDAALWCRHTLYSPQKGAAYAELWAAWFEPQAAPQVFYETFPLDSVRNSEKFFFVQTGKSWLRSQGGLGYLSKADQRLHWDLEFEAISEPHFPAQPKSLPGGRNTPLPALLCTGKIVLDDRPFALVQEPGTLTHFWRRADPRSGLWVHCNTFLEDADTWLEIGIGQWPLGPFSRASYTFSLCYRGQRFEWGPRKAHWQWVKGPAQGQHLFKAENREWRFEAQIEIPPSQWVHPPHPPLFKAPLACRNSKRGNVQLRVYRKQGGGWNWVEHLNAQESCAWEEIHPHGD